MRPLATAAFLTMTVLLPLSAPRADAACTHRKCADQAMIDDLRARIAAECDPSNSNYNFGGILGGAKILAPLDPCSPAALHTQYPHGLSAAPDCNYLAPFGCDQDFDVGVWYANGAGGHLIVGHPGLDMVLAVKDLGPIGHPLQVFGPVRPALVALDARFAGDEAAFCAAYGSNAYAPDLR